MKFRDLLPSRQNVSAGTGATDQNLIRLADEMGYNLVKEPATGRMVPVPKDIAPGDIPSVMTRWDSIYDMSFYSAENREKRIKMYELMDRSGAEGSVVLDVYADEIVNITDNSDKALQIQISGDDDLRAKIMQVLNANGVIANMRQDIRMMCKDGDCAYTITPRRGSTLHRVVETAANDGVKIDNPLRPEDITLHFARSAEYELAGYRDKIYKLRIERDVLGGFKYDMDEYMPWEFAPFIIMDRECFPYGRSVLEKMRIPFEQLMVLEKLLAVSRANSIDRVAVKVPGMGADISSFMAKASQLKNSLKTLLQMGSNSRMTRNQDVGLTEWLVVPKEFEVSKLSTAITLGSPDDVIYFRDKLYNASRLPKGFFVLSEGNNTQRPMSLRQQDLKFARSLIPVSEAYCNGLRHLILLLAFYLGGDVSKIQVKVSLKKSPYISSDLLQTHKDVLDMINTHATIRQQVEKDYVPSKKDILALLDMVGAPASLFFPEDAPEGDFDGNASQTSGLFEHTRSANSLYDCVQQSLRSIFG